MAVDGRGIEITPGDVVVYSAGGKYVERIVARVMDVKKRVQLGEVDSLHGTYDPNREEAWRAQPRWVDPSSCFVVGQLPFAPNRLNTI